MPGQSVIWRRYRPQLRLGVRITVASLLAFALCHLLGFAQSYAAVITAVIVTQSNVGASLKAMLDRFIGSLGGALWGVAVLLALHRTASPTRGTALIVALAPLAFLAAFKPAYRAAPITAAILLLTPDNSVGPLASALNRILQIGIGSVVALGVALLILPSRAHRTLASAAGRALLRMGELATALMKGVSGHGEPGAIQDLHDSIRRALAETEAAADEDMRERAVYFGGSDPQPLCRTLRRLRNDLAMIGRIMGEPLPEPLRPLLADSTSSVIAAIAEFLTTSGNATANLESSPPLEEVVETLGRHASTVAEGRRIGIFRELPDETVGRVFGLTFALEQISHNLKDLVDRTDELTRQ